MCGGNMTTLPHLARPYVRQKDTHMDIEQLAQLNETSFHTKSIHILPAGR